MKDTRRRDSLLMIVGVGGLSIAFLLGVFLPGTRRAAAIEREIAEAEQAIRDIPLHIARRESLQREIADREKAVRRHAAAIPSQADLPSVVRQVAQFARDSQLTVTRLEPLPAVEHATYRELPMRVTLAGPFRGIVRFLHRLETQPRLFRFGDYTLNGENGRNGSDVVADVYFSACVGNAENAESAENDESPAGTSTDTNTD